MQFKPEMTDTFIALVKQVYEVSTLYGKPKYNNIVAMTIDHFTYSGTFGYHHVKYVLGACHDLKLEAPGLMEFFEGLDETLKKHKEGKFRV